MGDSWKKGDKVLYITPAPSVPAEAASIEAAIGAGGLRVISRSSIVDDKLNELASTYDAIISMGSSAASHSSDFLFELARVLKPAGALILREPLLLAPQNGIVTALRTEKDVESALVLSGFTSLSFKNTQEAPSVASFPSTDGSADVSTRVATFEIRSSKPNWEFGASASLSFAKQAAPVWALSGDDMIDDDIPIVKSTPGSTWKLDADDAELIDDEDALLEKEDLAKPDKVYDCGPGKGGKKKACKDCSCGLAEELDQGKTPKKKSLEQASSCGSCYLGDAFRCASCPYTGLPAFKPGEKISIANLE